MSIFKTLFSFIGFGTKTPPPGMKGDYDRARKAGEEWAMAAAFPIEWRDGWFRQIPQARIDMKEAK